MTRSRTHKVSMTILLTYLFLARDILKPPAVTGATRRVTPAQSQATTPNPQQTFAQPQAASLPTPMATAAVKSVPPAVPLDPGPTFVSVQASASGARAVMSESVFNRVDCRTFEGRVESVVEEGSGDGPRQVVELVNVGGAFQMYSGFWNVCLYRGGPCSADTACCAGRSAFCEIYTAEGQYSG